MYIYILQYINAPKITTSSDALWTSVTSHGWNGQALVPALHGGSSVDVTQPLLGRLDPRIGLGVSAGAKRRCTWCSSRCTRSCVLGTNGTSPTLVGRSWDHVFLGSSHGSSSGFEAKMVIHSAVCSVCLTCAHGSPRLKKTSPTGHMAVGQNLELQTLRLTCVVSLFIQLGEKLRLSLCFE